MINLGKTYAKLSTGPQVFMGNGQMLCVEALQVTRSSKLTTEINHCTSRFLRPQTHFCVKAHHASLMQLRKCT